MNQLKKNTIHQVEVEGYSSEGDGVARIDGCVVFVKGALRGEICRIRLLKVLKNLAYAKVEEVVRRSPHRQTPACPVFEKCGGCRLLHMDYEEELALKRERVQDALRRIGGCDIEAEPVSGGCREHYRNKAVFAVAGGPEGSVTGFYRAHSHDVVPAEACIIQTEPAARAAAAVRRWMDACHVPPYQEKERTGCVRHIFVRYGTRTRQLQVTVVSAWDTLPRPEKLLQEIRTSCPETVSIVHNINKTAGNTVLAGRFETLWGDGCLTDRLCGVEFRLSPRSFYQVNHDQAEVLYEKALSLAGLTGEETVLDLYCGTGTITLCAARRAKTAVGAEIVPEAIRDAEKNRERNGISNARFLCADASEAAAGLRGEGLSPDVVIVDPPRKGLAPDVIGCIAAMQPPKVVYVSCDPATRARDVRLFAEKGYAVRRAQPVDMFPGTTHVETVCLLSRNK